MNPLTAFAEGYFGRRGVNDLYRAQADSINQDISNERKRAWVMDMSQVLAFEKAGQYGQAQALMQERLNELGKLGGDPQHTAAMLRMAQEGRHDELIAGLEPIVARGMVEYDLAGGSDEPASIREWRIYSSWSPEKQAQYREMKRANQLVGMGGGLEGVVGGGKVTPVTTGSEQSPDDFRAEYAGAEAGLEGAKAGAKRAAELSTEFSLSPKVQGAVKTAVAQAQAAADQSEENRSSARALEVYETAMNGLAEALHNTETGPFVGWIPAVTENQQIASGAIAAMAPVLKQMFRSAGEGIFTDRDQQLLLDMVPTRKDKPGARVWKMENIDAIVRAKLGNAASQPVTDAAPDVGAPRTGGQLMQDANGNRAMVYPDGTFEEVR